MKFEFTKEEIEVLKNMLNVALKSIGGEEIAKTYLHFVNKLNHPIIEKTEDNTQENDAQEDLVKKEG